MGLVLEEATEICPACGHAYAYRRSFAVSFATVMFVICVERTTELEIVCPSCVTPGDHL
jgi:hypothetical protein